MNRALPLLLLLAACQQGTDVADAIGNSGQAGDPRPPVSPQSQPLDPGAQPVRIGEGGPRFNACLGTGRVVNTKALDVRAAPFGEAEKVDALAADMRVAICSRSLDQRWLGVVYPPPGQPDLDCGVSGPVERAQGYEGPCRSGWISSAFVRLVAR
ncbi:hypothetical protein D1610_02455 [Sphingomonas gilva]|uniref:Integron n=1 Tax=Sphingomonas gilva TaxID=2305907 RepID=A0A396RU91_9SPHN|nr:hypothetical protein [Sphingomonas gilva]RHW19012.1 hypothetical protein D1610_02455 [Sphingomonas gilva]